MIMKNILFFFILVHLSTYGQMLDKSKKWNDLEIEMLVKKCKCSGGFEETHSYSLGKDSIIKEKTYYELIDSVYSIVDGNLVNNRISAFEYIAELDKKIYMIYYLDPYFSENILYDFNLSVGDTFNFPPFYYNIVAKIDSSEYFGKKYKTFHFTDSLVWIEGIGSNAGFIYQDIYSRKLLCVSKNDTLIYKNNLGYDCITAELIDNIKETYNINNLKIYPNPTSEKIFIESDKIINRIDLTDIYGKLRACLNFIQ